ncbi:MAG: IclR family transcriptional regulator [Rhodomicrobium sp.]|nr:IclR family transcriptional regulator [Rhodomicrobium sp.]
MESQRLQYSPLGKAFAILDVLAREAKPVGAPDLCAELELNRQTVHRLLKQLESLGYVRRYLDRERYVLGTDFTQLALNAIVAKSAGSLRQPVMERLVDVVRETCNLGVLDGHQVLYIDRVECDWPLRVQLKPGSRLPAYCTAIGKLLLGHLPPEKLRQYLRVVPLRRLTPNTITDPDQFTEAMREIRKNGYAINNQEDSVGLLAISVPVFDPRGAVAAGLAIHGPEIRLPRERAISLLPQLTETARELSAILFHND